MKKFKSIRALAEKRKGGKQVLEGLLPKPLSSKQLAKKSDDRCLSMMSKCIFRAGFNWKVIDKKWPDFEKAFYPDNPIAKEWAKRNIFFLRTKLDDIEKSVKEK